MKLSESILEVCHFIDLVNYAKLWFAYFRSSESESLIFCLIDLDLRNDIILQIAHICEIELSQFSLQQLFHLMNPAKKGLDIRLRL